MTMLESPPATATTNPRQPVLVCISVALVMVVGWVCYRHWGFVHVESWAMRSDFVMRRWWLVNLVIAMLLAAPYAIALLAWGRGVNGRLAGFVVGLGAGVYFWGVDRFFQNYVWGTGPASNTSARVYTWFMLLGIATLVPLAWGLARRTGRVWLLGLVAGPAVAAVLRELELRSSWWRHLLVGSARSEHWVLEAAVYVAPFVAAGLACWAIEAATTRRTPEVGSEIGSSA